MLDTVQLTAAVTPFLFDNEEPKFIFMGANFDASIRNGGSTRIVVVSDTSVVSLVTGLLKRTEARRVDQRWHPSLLANPADVWPGRSLIGEEWGTVLPGLWAHRRYRETVQAAYDHATWLYR